LIQLPTGEAAFLDSGLAVSSGVYSDKLRTAGKVVIAKTTGVVLLPGQRGYWDHSARSLTYQKVNDKDFLAGIVTADAASAQPWAELDLNKPFRPNVDIARDGHLTVLTGTQSLNVMGVFRRGGAHKMILSTTSEVQKMDMMSVDGFAVASNPIVEAIFRPVSVGAGTAPDFNIGVANGTHGTDFETIGEFVVVHLNGNASDLFAMSDDGSTDVAETDTTVNVSAGSAVANRVHCLFDIRNPADIQIYVNGALVNDATTFTLAAATGPLFLIAHLEKSSAADVFEVDVDSLAAWTSEQ
jgi:hypothetical protein